MDCAMLVVHWLELRRRTRVGRGCLTEPPLICRERPLREPRTHPAAYRGERQR